MEQKKHSFATNHPYILDRIGIRSENRKIQKYHHFWNGSGWSSEERVGQYAGGLELLPAFETGKSSVSCFFLVGWNLNQFVTKETDFRLHQLAPTSTRPSAPVKLWKNSKYLKAGRIRIVKSAMAFRKFIRMHFHRSVKLLESIRF